MADGKDLNSLVTSYPVSEVCVITACFTSVNLASKILVNISFLPLASFPVNR